MPLVADSGCARSPSEAAFTRARLATIASRYLVLDAVAVVMMQDPYFVVGPDAAHPLPPHLARLPPRLLLLYRQLASLAGILSAIEAVFALCDLAQYWLLKALAPSRATLCFHSTTFGSFSRVLDRGLAGWWGDWWHQTFRQQFLAPSAYLVRRRLLARGSPWASAVAIFISFAQSGFLHGLGSITSARDTKLWRAPAFFLLQAVGILVQQGLTALARRHLPTPSPALSRAANLLFALLWLHATAGLFIDDISSAGLWLHEPVPISPMRFMGFGHPQDDWLRWDRRNFPTWHSGRHWWESGIAL